MLFFIFQVSSVGIHHFYKQEKIVKETLLFCVFPKAPLFEAVSPSSVAVLVLKSLQGQRDKSYLGVKQSVSLTKILFQMLTSMFVLGVLSHSLSEAGG